MVESTKSENPKWIYQKLNGKEKRKFIFLAQKWSSEHHHQGLKGAKTTTELCPPKPKEFEIAA